MSVEEWTGVAFRDEATAWVTDRLREHGAALRGPGDQPHARPWSTALRFETSAGRVWFKANAVGTRSEPAVLRVLADRVPTLVPELLAVDVDRGWSLCRDAGPVLRQAIPDVRSRAAWDAWAGVLGRYAEAQVRLSSESTPLLAAGMPRVTPGTIPAQARRLLADLALCR